MNRSKIVAIVTGAISILLAIAYLVIVQILDFRGEMLPAPQDQLSVISYQLSVVIGNWLFVDSSSSSAPSALQLAGIMF